MSVLQTRLQDVNALVKIKNPSLLLQLQRTPAPPVRLVRFNRLYAYRSTQIYCIPQAKARVRGHILLDSWQLVG